MNFRLIFKQHKKNFFLALAAAVLFVLGLLIGSKMHNFSAKGELLPGQIVIREHEKDFKMISPLLMLGDSTIPEGFKSLDDKVSAFINDSKNARKIDGASVYFRDLNNGQWMGVNEKENYAPASIYKVALMITVLKAAEGDNSILSKKIVYDIKPEERPTPSEADAPRIELGKPYPVAELLARMIIYSDNDAFVMLQKIIDFNDSKKVFDDLGLEMPLTDDNRDIISPESISRFFRVLFNSTYLPRNISEFALEILSEADFKDGLVAGVPADIAVAHKYGFRAATTQEPVNEFHDCGIVYHPVRPYFLCVMTKGTDAAVLKNTIKQISDIVYREVNAGR